MDSPTNIFLKSTPISVTEADCFEVCLVALRRLGWLRGTAVERRSLASELSLSSARPVADGSSLRWETVRYRSTNQANSAFHPFGVNR